MGKLHERVSRELTIYVRQLAWLNATPKPAEGTRRAKLVEKGGTTQPSRLEAYRAGGAEPPMPPNPLPHFVAWLLEIGLSQAVGMGIGPLSWHEINQWQRATGITLAPWEARLIRRLSTEYVAQGRRSESENCPAPWHSKPTQSQRETEVSRLRLVLG